MRERKYTPESIGRTDVTFAETVGLYTNARADERRGRLRISAAMTDTGQARAMLPGLDKLTDNHEVRVFAREAAADVIKAEGLAYIKVPHLGEYNLEWISGDVVLTGMASNPTLELLTNKAANEKGIPVAAIEDYPGAYPVVLKEAFDKYPQTRPNRLMVMNDWAKDANLEQLPWFNPDHVLVTGQPAFDYIATEDRKQMKADLYPQLGLNPEEELVVWMGQRGGTKEAFQLFVDALTQIKADFRLAIRRHPRDVVQMEEYEEMAGVLRPRLVNTDGIPTSAVGAVASRMGTIYSTEAFSAVMRGTPSVHFLTPEILALTESPGTVVPIVDDGSSRAVYDAAQSRSEVAKLFNEDANLELQDKMAAWKPDGKAGGRVATALVKIAEGLK